MGITQDDLLLECVLRWERERGDHAFLTQPFGGGQVRHWTWAQAVGEARRMAAYLKAQEWEPGTRIAILSKNCAWWIMADLAIWMSGHVSVPIYPSLRAQSIRQILEHSEARACFLGATDDKETASLLSLPGITWISFPTANVPAELSWQSLADANFPLAGRPSRPADDLATIIYTSGTTGAPKGVMHRFGALAFDAKILAGLLTLTKDQRVLSYLPLAHIVERAGLEVATFRLGSHIFFTEGIETFLEDLQRARPTIFLSVPRLLLKFQQGVFAKVPKDKLDRLLRIPAVRLFVKRRILRQLGLNTVQHAACGAAPLPPEILLWYRNLGLQLGEGYGMTETMITHLPRPDSVRPGYVGCALEGVETRVTDDGELQIRSPMNMVGYYKDPQATAAAFTEDGFFRTGDLASIEPDGQTKIIGRLKEQFKTSKGKYVAPAPIESRLMEHPAVDACCLMGAGQPSPFALVILSDAARETCLDPDARSDLEASLLSRMEEVNAELDPFERLSMIVVADGPWSIANGLMTPTLKLKRSVLENRYQALIDDWEAQGRRVVWESVPGVPAAVYTAGAAANSVRQSDNPPSQT
ncbi:MAG TPA: AMP-binding protein [Bryobacteraceae bacterium]|nr:AMP-binding protein [Bryobacteraceae bacterium]